MAYAKGPYFIECNSAKYDRQSAEGKAEILLDLEQRDINFPKASQIIIELDVEQAKILISGLQHYVDSNS